MELLTAAFILASLSPLAHAGVIGLREAPSNNSSLPSCPAVDGDLPVFHPHPTNCSLFFQCWQGHPYLYSCPAGLYWDQHLSTCNWPSQVECHANETLNLYGVAGLREAPRDNSSLPSCPAVDGEFPVFHPHPTNCSLFYQCWQGHPYLYSCPAGLYWDQHLSTCNWPSQVECHLDDSTEEPSTEDPSVEDTTLEDGTEKLALDNSILPSCPSSADPVYFPHPSNCSLFYECSNGIPYLMSCPAGLYFDPLHNICNYPNQVTCNAFDETTKNPTEEPFTTSTENPSSNKTRHSNVIQFVKSLPTCPDIDGNMSVYFPHPQNCSLFYECSNGIPCLFSCPGGLYFDPTLNICNSPSQVACNATNETTQKPTEESSKPTEEPPKPTEEPLKTTEEPLKTTEEPSKPTDEPSKPTDEPSNPTEEPSKPTEDPSNPTEQPSTPTEELSKTTEKSVEEPYEPIDKEGSGLLSRA